MNRGRRKKDEKKKQRMIYVWPVTSQSCLGEPKCKQYCRTHMGMFCIYSFFFAGCKRYITRSLPCRQHHSHHHKWRADHSTHHHHHSGQWAALGTSCGQWLNHRYHNWWGACILRRRRAWLKLCDVCAKHENWKNWKWGQHRGSGARKASWIFHKHPDHQWECFSRTVPQEAESKLMMVCNGVCPGENLSQSSVPAVGKLLLALVTSFYKQMSTATSSLWISRTRTMHLVFDGDYETSQLTSVMSNITYSSQRPIKTLKLSFVFTSRDSLSIFC